MQAAIIRRLLKKHRYPPDGMDDAVQTVMVQCELWADHPDIGGRVKGYAERLADYAMASRKEPKGIEE